MSEPDKEESSKQARGSVDNHFFALSKTYKSLPSMEVNKANTIDSAGDNESPIVSRVILNTDKEGISLSKPLSPFDLSVQEAVVSLCEQGYSTITANDIARVMGSNKSHCGRALLEAIQESIEKQSKIEVVVDRLAEARGRATLPNGDEFTVLKGTFHLLEVRTLEMRTKRGNYLFAVEVLREPGLYSMDKALGQISACPQSLIESISSRVSATKQNIAIRDYLLKRVSQSKNAKGGKNEAAARSARYDTVVKRCELESRPIRRTVRTVHEVMKGIQSEKYIQGWKEYTTKKDKRGKHKSGVKWWF